MIEREYVHPSAQNAACSTRGVEVKSQAASSCLLITDFQGDYANVRALGVG
jgi:hypothetical protein